MPEHIEISALDLRYEPYRLKAAGAEKTLLASILGNGIRDPLSGADIGERHILLDGFKRYRCAVKLGIGMVPYTSIGDDEACGLIALLRASTAKSVSILEQARLIDALKTVHQMTCADIAGLLQKSKAWVSVRFGIVREMSASVAEHIFAGRFPVHSFMYTLRPFMRINGVSKDDVDAFVALVAGKNLSIRDIDLLTHGYFRGPADFRRQMAAGNIKWVLDRVKKAAPVDRQCTKVEQDTLKMLDVASTYMQKLIIRCRDSRCKTDAFFARANLLSGGIIRQIPLFAKAMEDFYDHSRQTQGGLPALPGGDGGSADRPTAQCQHQYRSNHYRAEGTNARDRPEGPDRGRSGSFDPAV